MIINLTNHAATPAQVNQGIIDHPDQERLKELINIPAGGLTHEEYYERAHELIESVLNMNERQVMIGGHFNLTLAIVHVANTLNVDAFFACTERASEDVTQPDGSIIKTSRFVFTGLEKAFSPTTSEYNDHE